MVPIPPWFCGLFVHLPCGLITPAGRFKSAGVTDGLVGDDPEENKRIYLYMALLSEHFIRVGSLLEFVWVERVVRPTQCGQGLAAALPLQPQGLFVLVFLVAL